MWSIKASLMALYYDISKHVTDRVKMLMHVTSGLLLVTVLVVISVSLGWCRPITANWSLGPDMCTPQAHVFPVAFTSCLHVITDILVLSIPILILRTLQLQRAQMVAVYFIFGIGFLAFTVALVSLGLQIQVVGLPHESSSYFQEIQIKTERVYLAGVAECSIAIVGANLPSLRVFLRMILQTRETSSQARRVKIGSGSGATKYSKEQDPSPNSRKPSNWSNDPTITISEENGDHNVYPGDHNIYPGDHYTTGTAADPSQPGSSQPGKAGVDDSPAISEDFSLRTLTPATISRTGSLRRGSECSGKSLLNNQQNRPIGEAHILPESSPSLQTMGPGNSSGHEHQQIELGAMQNYCHDTNEGASVGASLPSRTNTGIGITLDYDVQYSNVHPESIPVEPRRQQSGRSTFSADSESHGLRPTGTYGHQRTWSGPGAPIPVPLPVSSKRWQN